MGIFDVFPWTNFHEVNLDWIINRVKELGNAWDDLSKTLDPKIVSAVNQWFDEHPEQADALQVATDAKQTAEQAASVAAAAEDAASHPESVVKVGGHIDPAARLAWLTLTIPRAAARVEIGNNGDVQNDSAQASVFDWAQNNDCDIAINCDYFPSKMMLAGVQYGTSDRENVLTYTAYNPTTEDFKLYPAGTSFQTIKAAGYTYIFGTSWQLLDNGAPMTTAHENKVDPRMTFGWDNANYYICVNLGRNAQFDGITPAQQRAIMQELGALYAVNFDGGGSTQMAIRQGGAVMCVNGVTDYGKTPRKVPLHVAFKLMEG